MASGGLKQWLKPEVYPLFAALGVGISFLFYQSARAVTKNPDVVWDKDKRKAGDRVDKEGKEYRQGAFRKFVRSQYNFENVSTPLQPSEK